VFKSEWRKNPMWTARLWFGGLDFKGQPQSHNIQKFSGLAVRHIDVITTSGIATGHAPDTQKIESIRSLIGDHPLANASGTTINNVSGLIAAGVDAFLVSTGISKPRSDEFDASKTNELCELIRTSR
jgi:uncharacterized protein